MSLARLVVTAVLVEARPKAAVARDYGVSRRWVHELVRRFLAEGEAGLEPRSRRPRGSPHRIAEELEREIVDLRKHLGDTGLDAGAHTIAVHLERRHASSPAPSTIWRVLSRRGFVTPQPQKRPRSSFCRFEAEMPNERWQADITHWALADGTDVEILNALDDHSRFLVASDARAVFKAADVVASFQRRWDPRAPGLAAHGQRRSVHGRAPGRRALRDRGGGRPSGGPAAPLEPLPPADLREGGAVPPDAQALAPQAASGALGPGAPGPAGRVPHLLQRGQAAPGDRPTHPGRSLRGPSEGHPDWAQHPDPLPRAARSDRRRRGGHALARFPAAPPQRGSAPREAAGADAGGRSPRADRDRRRGAGARTRLGPDA